MNNEAVPQKVDYVILYVTDMPRSIAFYRDVVGLEFKFEQAGYAEFVTSGTKFGLYETEKLETLIGSKPTPGGTSMEVVFLVDEVDSEVERLKALGVELLSGPVDRAWGHRTIHFSDPDGHVVEFAQEIVRQESD
jgi:lactoylglutathione lyase